MRVFCALMCVCTCCLRALTSGFGGRGFRTTHGNALRTYCVREHIESKAYQLGVPIKQECCSPNARYHVLPFHQIVVVVYVSVFCVSLAVDLISLFLSQLFDVLMSQPLVGPRAQSASAIEAETRRWQSGQVRRKGGL